MKSLVGTKVNVSPFALQDPDGAGARTGVGELFDSGAEKVTVIGAFAATPFAPLTGVMRARASAAGGALVVVELVLDGVVVVPD
jgi:hypothetical protein